MLSLHKEYENRVTEGSLKVNSLTRQLYLFGFIRLILFVFSVASPFLLYKYNVRLAILAPFVFFTLFLLMVKYFQRLALNKRFEQIKISINSNELRAIKHEFDQFDHGSEFIDPHHMNSYDLDVFGQGSLFQYLNRTATPAGKIKLAKMLQDPLLKSDRIIARQQLIQELSAMPDWRQNFSVYGTLYGNNDDENKLFDTWATQGFSLNNEKIVKVLLYLLPVLSLGTLAYWIGTGVSGWFILASTAQAIVWGIEAKNIKIIYGQFGKKVLVLQKYENLLMKIEKHAWQSQEGRERCEILTEHGYPSEQARNLRQIIAAFDNRNNIIMGFILNLVFMWDLWQSYRLVIWHRRNKANYPVWIDTIAFFDACNSLANYAYNNKEFIFPHLEIGGFSISAAKMGHPLINPKKRVCNNFTVEPSCSTIIITGANMSGKSTFLRTIGVNMVLGMAGAPVCAAEMSFKPVVVFSNMRTTDSLFDDESYFFAELKRLQLILEEVDKGHELLIILDEILKGTNSVDKLFGSQKLVERLTEQGTPSIIATHDLKLTEIEKQYPGKVKNQCFEISIINDEMNFDYTLRDGVTTVMNATFLMKKMGIIK